MDSALGRLSQVRLQFGEGLLDRVEVGAVGREEQERGADAFDSGTNRWRLVAREVVHNDHVAGSEFRHQDTGDVGEERIGVHRSVEHPGRDHAGAAQAGDEGRGLPMPEGDAGAQALTPPAATMAPCHVGGGPGLVDEDQLVGVEIELAVEPLLAALQDVGTILLRCMAGLFLRVIPWRAKKRHSVAMLTLTPRSASISRNSASVGSG